MATKVNTNGFQPVCGHCSLLMDGSYDFIFAVVIKMVVIKSIVLKFINSVLCSASSQWGDEEMIL